MSVNDKPHNTLIFICGDMKTPRKMSVVSLLNNLAESGEGVTAITDARCNITDFRYDYRIQRLSFDMGIEGCFNRAEKLAYFLSGIPNAVVVHTDTAREEFLSDAEIIEKYGCKLICLETDGFLKCSLASPHSVSRYNAVLLNARAVVSGSAADYLVNLNSGMTNAVYIPLRFPFTAGEFRPAACDGSQILLVLNDPSFLSEKLVAILTNIENQNEKVTVRVISGDESRSLDKDAIYKHLRPLPRVELADDDETVNDAALECAFAIVADRFIYPSYSFLMLSARLIPVVFASGYADSAFDMTEPDKLFENIVRLLDTAERKREADILSAHYSDDQNKRILSDWLRLIKAVNEDIALPKLAAPPVEDKHAAAILRLNDEICAVVKPTLPVPAKHTAVVESIHKKIDYRELKRYQRYACIQLPPEDVRRSQLLALKMLKALEAICKKHGLRYYIAAGSLLGAVRHGGQIPWDDDVDVTMPRRDYERFIKLAQTELPDDMILPVNNYPYGFHRIQIKNTAIERALRQKGPHGIFLDILPLDGAAPSPELKKKHAQINERMIFIMYESVKPQPVLNRQNLSVWVKRLLLKYLVPKRILQSIWHRNAVKYDVDKSSEWVCLPGYYGYGKECFDKSWWGEPVMMMYDGRPCPVMREWKKYLTLHYGDYMQPPPPLYRRTHFFYGVDFGKYKNMTIEEIEREVYNA